MQQNKQNLIAKCPVCGEIIRISSVSLNSNNNQLTCTFCAWEFTADENSLIAKSNTEVNVKQDDLPIIKTNNLKTTNQITSSNLTKQQHNKNKQTAKVIPTKNQNKSNNLTNNLNITEQNTEQKNLQKISPKKAPETSLEKTITKVTTKALDKKTEVKATETETKANNINNNLHDQDLFEDLSLPINLISNEQQNYFSVIFCQIILCSLLIMALILQYVHYNKDQLSSDDDLRPKLELWCRLVKCQLPYKSDLSKLTINYLTVRNNPKFNDVLRISLLMNNEANFDQVFPNLDIKLLASDGKNIASRVFAPDEYLAGELAGQKVISANTKIRISLDVIEPQEEKITNYQINFLPNKL